MSAMFTASYLFVRFAFGFLVAFGLAAIVKFLTFRDGQLAFCAAVAKVKLHGHDGHALLLDLNQQTIDLAPVQQKLSFPERVVIPRPPGLVLRDVAVYQPSLSGANFC